MIDGAHLLGREVEMLKRKILERPTRQHRAKIWSCGALGTSVDGNLNAPKSD